MGYALAGSLRCLRPDRSRRSSFRLCIHLIAIPACIGYLSRIDWMSALGFLALIIATHGIGVWLGSRFAGKVPVQGLKIFVAVFSVCGLYCNLYVVVRKHIEPVLVFNIYKNKSFIQKYAK